jgi:hypothetical protein
MCHRFDAIDPDIDARGETAAPGCAVTPVIWRRGVAEVNQSWQKLPTRQFLPTMSWQGRGVRYEVLPCLLISPRKNDRRGVQKDKHNLDMLVKILTASRWMGSRQVRVLWLKM